MSKASSVIKFISTLSKCEQEKRYICKDCHKTFTDFTYSPCYTSKKIFTSWLSYIKCMIEGYLIRKYAEIVEISIPTSFLWRHKIFNLTPLIQLLK